MPAPIRFIVPGKVQPWQRAGGSGKRRYTPAPTRSYETLVGYCARVAMRGREPLTGYVTLDLRIICPIPPAWSRLRKRAALAGDLLPTTGDVDNITKSVCDGLNRVAYLDDRQIVSLRVARRYGTEPKAYATITEVTRLPEPLEREFTELERFMQAVAALSGGND